MEKVDKSLYDVMRELIVEKSSDYTKDVEFVGTITTDEPDVSGEVATTHDVFMVIDDMPDGTIVRKFYNENKQFIAARDKDGKIYPSAEFAMQDLSFLGQLDALNDSKGISLNEMDVQLNELAKALGIEREKILSMSEVDLDQLVSTQENEEPTISLEENGTSSSEQTVQANENALNNINSKQEIDLNQKVDDKHTLAEILGVSEGSKLISVYSDAIKDNKNTTRFSFIIKEPDGTLSPADMLEQVGGKDSDKNIYETNRDGSKVEKQNVLSSYAIKSPIVKNAILTARIGQMGYTEIGYGQMDKTNHRDALTQNLETERTRYTTYEVRKEFSQKNGVDNISDDMDEIKAHEEHGCNDLSLDEADGDLSTGHNHEEAIEQIKQYDRIIADVFTDNEIEDRLHKIAHDFPEESFEEIIYRTQRDLAEDASRMHAGPML